VLGRLLDVLEELGEVISIENGLLGLEYVGRE
jgi:hypothetical protein